MRYKNIRYEMLLKNEKIFIDKYKGLWYFECMKTLESILMLIPIMAGEGLSATESAPPLVCVINPRPLF